MAAENWNPNQNRDLILANYQAASGNEDIETCISVLESHEWDLQAALNTHFVAQESENNERPNAGFATQQSDSGGRDRGSQDGRHRDRERLPDSLRRSPSPIEIDQPPLIDLTPQQVQPQPLSGIVRPVPQLFSSFSSTSTQSTQRTLRFQIIWQEKTFPVSLAQTETVGTLKRMLELQTGVDPRIVNLEGWPAGDSAVNDNTVLSTLDLSDETHLVLHMPPKVTVSRAEHKPCNIPACRSPPTGRRSASPGDEPPSIIDVDVGDKGESSTEEITLNVNYEGRDYRLRYKAQQTVKVVKQELFLLTKTATRLQEWTGWPDGVTDKSKLGELDLQRDHFLMMVSKQQVQEQGSSSSFSGVMDMETNIKNTDSGTAGSPEDTDFEETIISDTDESIFDPEATQSKRIAPLLPRDASDSSETIIKFQYQFEDRYGAAHPSFFMGPLKDALTEASGETASERRPLLIYLHHDQSILANIFCSQILCSEQVTSYINQNFVIWPWDMTFESNRQRFVNMLVQHFGNTAANTVSKFRDGEYPLLLIVMKSKAGLEVCSVLQANTSLDELMMSLINGYEVFEQAKNIEVRSEQERIEREMMKQEQDAAYYESLAADRAKSEAETIQAEKEYEEQKQAALDAQIKEAAMLSCVDQLPDEPPKTKGGITNILFRFPDGGRESRRFNGEDKVKMVFMYVTSKGFGMEDHRIVTNFPRRQITEEMSDLTLKDGKLCPQATLFVEEL